jgi:hypothetical protein
MQVGHCGAEQMTWVMIQVRVLALIFVALQQKFEFYSGFPYNSFHAALQHK